MIRFRMLGAKENQQRHFVHLNHVESWKGHAGSLMSTTNYNLAFAMSAMAAMATGVAYIWKRMKVIRMCIYIYII